MREWDCIESSKLPGRKHGLAHGGPWAVRRQGDVIFYLSTENEANEYVKSLNSHAQWIDNSPGHIDWLEQRAGGTDPRVRAARGNGKRDEVFLDFRGKIAGGYAGAIAGEDELGITGAPLWHRGSGGGDRRSGG